MDWAEILGYTASVVIAISLTMSSTVALRWVNMLGAILFSYYGILIDSYPVAALNFFTALVNLVYLMRLRRAGSEAFELMQVDPREDRYLKRFLKYFREDIDRYFPDFDHEALERSDAFFVLRDMMPAALFVGENKEGGDYVVHLDYAIPAFRDRLNTRYLFDRWVPRLRRQGVTTLVTRSQTPAHIRYLERMGFQPDPQRGAGWYLRKLEA